MKAIIVIDLPKKCVLCKFGALNGNCWIVGQYHGYKDERPTWCPLKPLPQKLKLRIQREWITDYDRYEIGYNACLDKILGETE